MSYEGPESLVMRVHWSQSHELRGSTGESDEGHELRGSTGVRVESLRGLVRELQGSTGVRVMS